MESARASVPSLAQVVAGEPLRGSCGHIRRETIYSALAIDSQFSRRFGVPTGRWKNYLHPSASVARPRQVGRPVFQAQACRC